MRYVTSRGEVTENSIHWSRPVVSFWIIVGVISSFFSSLLAPLTALTNSDSSSRGNGNNNFRGFGSGGGSGGGGNRGGPGMPRPRGGFRTTSDIMPPPMAGGCGCG